MYATSSLKITVGVVTGGGGRSHSNDEYTTSLRKKYTHTFSEVITKENLYSAWNDFMRGKRLRGDVNEFASRLVDNLHELYVDLASGGYVHGVYEEYIICDPKKRIIHKASVRDRVVHRLIYNALYQYFDNRFIFDSYSCRNRKGSHKALVRFRHFTSQVSSNYTKQCYVLKFDIKKCFASIDTDMLKSILSAHISDEQLFIVIRNIIYSFGNGLPLGNLTSQLFINIYLHELDIFVKHELGLTWYLRYADDVVIVGQSCNELKLVIDKIEEFIYERLLLTVHKIQIKSIYSGVDVLGGIFFPKYVTLRKCTLRRMEKRRLSQNS